MNIELNPKDFLTTIKTIKTILDLVSAKDPVGYAITITAEQGDDFVTFASGIGAEFIRFDIDAFVQEAGELTINSNFISKLQLRGKKLQIIKTNQELQFKCGRLKGNFPNLSVTQIIPENIDNIKLHPINSPPILNMLQLVKFKSDLVDHLTVKLESTEDLLSLTTQDSVRGISSSCNLAGVTLYHGKEQPNKFIDHTGKTLTEILKPATLKKVKFIQNKTEEEFNKLINQPIEEIDITLIHKYLNKYYELIDHDKGENFVLTVYTDILEKILKLEDNVSIGYSDNIWVIEGDNFLFISSLPVEEIQDVNSFIINILDFSSKYKKLKQIALKIVNILYTEPESSNYFKIFHILQKYNKVQDMLSSLLPIEKQDDFYDILNLDITDSQLEEEDYAFPVIKEEEISNILAKKDIFAPFILEILDQDYPYISFDVQDSVNALSSAASVIFEDINDFTINLKTQKTQEEAKCTTEVGNCKGETFFTLLEKEKLDVNLCSSYIIDFLKSIKKGNVILFELGNIIMRHNLNGITTNFIMPQTNN